MDKVWRFGKTKRQFGGGALVFVGVSLTVTLAVLGGVAEPPPASTQGLIAFISIVGQTGGAWAFAGQGRADPKLAERSVGRLISLANKARQARISAEVLQESNTSKEELRHGVGGLSVHLSYLEEGYVEAMEDCEYLEVLRPPDIAGGSH